MNRTDVELEACEHPRPKAVIATAITSICVLVPKAVKARLTISLACFRSTCTKRECRFVPQLISSLTPVKLIAETKNPRRIRYSARPFYRMRADAWQGSELYNPRQQYEFGAEGVGRLVSYPGRSIALGATVALLVVLFLAACDEQAASPTIIPAPAETLAPIGAPTPTPAVKLLTGIERVSVTSEVRRGGTASVTIRTAPGVECTVQVHLELGPIEADGLEPQIADDEGLCSWSWHVDDETVPGDGMILAKAKGQGGQGITFTVVE